VVLGKECDYLKGEIAMLIKAQEKSIGELAKAEERDGALRDEIRKLKLQVNPGSILLSDVPVTPRQKVKGVMTPSTDPFRDSMEIVSTPVKTGAVPATPVPCPSGGVAGVAAGTPARVPATSPGMTAASGVKAAIEASTPPRTRSSAAAPAPSAGGPAGTPATAPTEGEAWTEQRTKSLRKSLKERLEVLDGEAVRNLLRQKPVGERAKSVGSLVAYFKMNKEARKTPLACWKALVRSCRCPKPVWYSLINSSKMELFFEDRDVAAATAALRQVGILVEGACVSSKDVFRRTKVYVKSYFRPLRLAALRGLERDVAMEVLRMAEELALKLADKDVRKQKLYQISIDKSLFSREDCAMDDGVPPVAS
jgi:hypothetical protein